MKKGNFVSLTAAIFAFALLFGACEKKGEETPPPSSTDTSQAPSATSPSNPSAVSPGGSTSPDAGSAQKPDDTSKAQKG
ncbi:MAG TPA: hypothetical protein VH851_10310 [Candidatus Binatia bacterium]|jgi:hypothetical protein